MNELDEVATWHPDFDSDLPDGLLAADDYAGAYAGLLDEDLIIDDSSAPGLVGIGYLGAALRRRFRLWCALAVVGLLLGIGVYGMFPPANQASVTVLLTGNPNEDPIQESQVDLSLAQSSAVASGIIAQLKLQDTTPDSLLKKFTFTAVTNHAVQITASAKTGPQAVQLAAAAATQFLKFRAEYTQEQEQQTIEQLNQQVSQAQASLTAITGQLAAAQAAPRSSGQQAQVKNLQAQEAAANNTLGQVQSYASGTASSTQTDSQAMISGSRVIDDAAPVQHSFLQKADFYAVAGLLAGLALGIVIVLIAAVTSDRLLRRDDIARAFGAPVRLSTGPLRRRRGPELSRKAAARRRDTARVVAYLRNAVSPVPDGPDGLAVVAVDDTETAARAVIDLATSAAADGKQVTIADLSAGARAARLLGVTEAGTASVTREGASVQVIVPPADAAPPAGPPATASGLVLCLATLDPAIGAEHLAAWAGSAVALVTAGRSTGVRIHAVGEMLRLAGLRERSVIVVDADRGDASLGALSGA